MATHEMVRKEEKQALERALQKAISPPDADIRELPKRFRAVTDFVLFSYVIDLVDRGLLFRVGSDPFLDMIFVLSLREYNNCLYKHLRKVVESIHGNLPE